MHSPHTARPLLASTAAALLMLVAGLPAHAQVAVVAGAHSGATALSTDQVAALYLGKMDKTPGIDALVLIDQPETAPAREQLYAKVLGKSAAQVKAAWTRLVFSGKAQLPRELGSAAEVKKFLAGNPNAIGYIEKSDVDSSVKVLLSAD